MNKFWSCILLLLLLSVSAEATLRHKDTVLVKYSGQYGEKSTIVVYRGCHVDEVEVDGHVSMNESQSQLLARAYGSEPLKDSSEIYSKWEGECRATYSDESEFFAYVFIGALYGPPAIYFGYNLIFRDYDNKGLMVLGRTGGAIWLVTGALVAFCGAIALGPSIMIALFGNSTKKADEYHEKYKKWNVRVAPAVNFNEPGGGLFMQMSF